MSQQQPITPEDPRLTAYALGELEGAERDAVAAAVAASVSLQQQVETIRAKAGAVEDAYALFNRVDGDAALFAQINRRLEEEAAALRSGSAQVKWDEAIPLRRPYLWWTPYALPAAATFVALLSVGALWLAGLRDGDGLVGVGTFASHTAEHAAFTDAAVADSPVASVAASVRQVVLGQAVAQKAAAPALASDTQSAPSVASASGAFSETAELAAATQADPVALPGLLPTRDILATRRWAAQPQLAGADNSHSGEMVARASSQGQASATAGRQLSDREAAVSSAAIAALPAEVVAVASAPVAAADSHTAARADNSEGTVAALPPQAFARSASAPAAAKASAGRASTADAMAVSRASRPRDAAGASASAVEMSAVHSVSRTTADTDSAPASVASDFGDVMREAQSLVQPVAVVAETPPAPQLETLSIPARPPLPLESADTAALPALSGPADNFDALMAAASAVMERRLSSPRLSVAEQPSAVPLPPKLDLANAYVQLSLWVEAGQLPPPRQVDVQAIVDAMKSASAADSGDASAGEALEQAVRTYAQVLHERPADATARLDAIAASLSADQRLSSEPQVSRFLSLVRETQKLLLRQNRAL